MDSIFGGFADLVEDRPMEHNGSSAMSFSGKLDPPLQIDEDGGASGCGGKVWIAGELLCEYILEKSNDNELLSEWNGNDTNDNKIDFRNVLELGSGTGIVGLVVALLEKQKLHKGIKVTATDIDQLVPLMQKNIDLNDVSNIMSAEELWWGEPLKEKYDNSKRVSHDNNEDIDLILAADCVYLEAAFPLLQKTLLDLTNCDNPPTILMAYRKRRKADKHFFQKIRKNFKVVEITDFMNHADYCKKRTHLFQLIRV